jgi:hypothetical protein
MPWPADGKPVGPEIRPLMWAMLERIDALSEYYGAEPGSPECLDLIAKTRLEGFQPRGYPGLRAKSEQAVKDLVLVYSVEKTMADCGTKTGAVTEAVEALSHRWKENQRKLRTRYYKLTRPKTDEDHRAQHRMAVAAGDFLKFHQK